MKDQKELIMDQVTRNKSNTIIEIAKALSQFQSECPVLQKGSQGYGYKYADLPSIVQTINPILKKCGLCFTQLTGGTAEAVSVTTILIHSKSGEYFESTIESSLKANTGKMSAIQATGSIITYFYLTGEKRAISSISKDIGLVSSFLDLSPAQWSRIVLRTGGERQFDQGCLRC